jgi:heme-degrading monooxygenase HmoA
MISPGSNLGVEKSMFAVVFEVQLDRSYADEYLRTAAALRPHLLEVEGFIRNERFRSPTRPYALLSLSLWDNEKALVRWRSMAIHHHAQAKGRGGVFEDYHLRVAEITRSSVRFEDRELGWMQHDCTEVGARALTLIESSSRVDCLQSIAKADGALSVETYEHLDDPQHTVTILSWPALQQAEEFFEDVMPTDQQLYSLRVIRDYGLKDRREAPQFYPPRAGL